LSNKKRNITISRSIWKKAEKIIPAGTQTFSKGPTQYVEGVAPVYLEKGKGSKVWDVDGNEYIDYSSALGPVTLGYCYPEVDRAIRKQLKNGITFSLMHPLEVEVSEMLIDTIPCAEMVRFGKNGSDATSGAVRLARAYTGRDKIVCSGYHGWQDWYIGTTTRDKGVPGAVKNLTLTFNYNDIESLEKVFSENPGQIAATIMEPIAIEEPRDDFLNKVKALTHKNGALLIFDEVVTGFRLAMGGAEEYYGVIPDIACFGKGMANGMPISAIVGRKEVMKELGEVFYSFTFGGEALSLAAAKATINVMKEKKVIAHFRKQGKKLKDGYNSIAKNLGLEENTGCKGLDAHSAMFFKDKAGVDSLIVKSLFQQEVLKKGILTLGVHNLSYSHTDKDVLKTLGVYENALKVVKKALEKGEVESFLEGKPIRPIFKRW